MLLEKNINKEVTNMPIKPSYNIVLLQNKNEYFIMIPDNVLEHKTDVEAECIAETLVPRQTSISGHPSYLPRLHERN
jgi:hypothetical protein